MDRDVLKCFEPQSFQVFSELCICVGYVCNVPAVSLKLFISFHFLSAHNLKVSQSKKLGLSQVFLWHAHNPEYVCGYLDPWEYIRHFQSPLCLSFCGFSFKILVTFLFAPALTTISGSCNIEQLPLVLANTLEKCCTQWESPELSQLKINSASRGF